MYSLGETKTSQKNKRKYTSLSSPNQLIPFPIALLNVFFYKENAILRNF